MHADPNDCYDQATKLLDKEYGNPHLISCRYIKELRQWEVLKATDTANYKKTLSIFVEMQSIQGR